MYCKQGDKPTIKYKFGNNPERIYQSKYAPIEVKIKEIPVTGTENYNPEGYLLIFRPLNSGLGVFSVAVVDYQLFYAPQLIGQGLQNLLAYIPCGQTNFTYKKDCSSYSQYSGCIESGPVDIQSLRIDPSRKCPTTNRTRCSIQIYYNKLLIFQDQGNCPINFSVQCGNCPEGFEEIPTTGYPGYCCLDCEAIAGEIASMTDIIRSMNK